MSPQLRRAVKLWVAGFGFWVAGLYAQDGGLAIWPLICLVAAGLHGCACSMYGYHIGYGDAIAQVWDELRDECDIELENLTQSDTGDDADDDERDRH